jgi:hypothetical protein
MAHPLTACGKQICCLHNRTEHQMRGFRQRWRADRGIMERICPHGIGHPDPDDLRIMSGEDGGRHGCDGCCAGVVWL